MRKTGELRVELLQHFHGLGYTLRDCMHPSRLGYRPAALAKLARQGNVQFPDVDEVEKEGRELAASRRR